MQNVSEELLTHVSEDDEQVLGPVQRRVVHGNPSLVHRAVHVLVLSKDGCLLLQKRSRSKDVQPGKWDTSVGGHVGWGQSYEEAARREAEEELGLFLPELNFLYTSRIRNAVESENIRTYWVQQDGPFVPQPEEIDEVRWWTKAQIEAEIGSGIFTSNFEEEFAAFKLSPQSALLK